MSIDDLLFGEIGAPLNVSALSTTTTSDITLPASWLQVLTGIRQQSGWSCSTIAGGALRDMENGRPIKDVDIFVPYPVGGNQEALLALQRAVPHAHIMEIEHCAHNTSQIGSDGISHFHFEVDGWKFEISQKTEQFDYQSLLDSFDIGLCMISMAQDNAIWRTTEYNLDKVCRQIKVVRQTGGRELEHAERIQRKYKDWKIIPL